MAGLITGLDHINLSVPTVADLEPAGEFYGDILGLHELGVPPERLGSLRWFQMPSGQQIHISVNNVEAAPDRFARMHHPCFRVASVQALQSLQARVWEHKRKGGSRAVAFAMDEPSEAVGVGSGGFPARFFVRDYAGNRLEFSI